MSVSRELLWFTLIVLGRLKDVQSKMNCVRVISYQVCELPVGVTRRGDLVQQTVGCSKVREIDVFLLQQYLYTQSVYAREFHRLPAGGNESWSTFYMRVR